MEGLLPKLHGDDAIEIPGARALLDALIAAAAPWAIVTSGTVPLVTGWLDRLALPRPEILVTAESVENGKPDPACYALGRSRLGLEDTKGDILVLEDSPAGIRSGKAAGCKVLGLVTSHTAEQVLAAGPDWVVRDLRSVRMVACDEEEEQQLQQQEEEGDGSGGKRRRVVTLQISDALVPLSLSSS